jgi:uncharacterized protein YdeI (BOF family)
VLSITVYSEIPLNRVLAAHQNLIYLKQPVFYLRILLGLHRISPTWCCLFLWAFLAKGTVILSVFLFNFTKSLVPTLDNRGKICCSIYRNELPQSRGVRFLFVMTQRLEAVFNNLYQAMKNHILQGFLTLFMLAFMFVPGVLQAAEAQQTQCTPTSVEITGISMGADTGTVTLRDLSGESIPDGWTLEIKRTETIEVTADGRAQTSVPFSTGGEGRDVALALVDANGNERDVFALTLGDTSTDPTSAVSEDDKTDNRTDDNEDEDTPSTGDESAPDDTPSSNNTQTGNLVINELLPDPTDGEEWVEIHNPNSFPVDVTGWSIIDGANHGTELGNKILNAGGYLIIENPSGNLNNSGDMIVLQNAEEETIDNVSYGNAGYDIPRDGDTLARFDDSFAITDNPTPGDANLPASETKDENNETNKDSSQSNTSNDNETSTTESAPDQNTDTSSGDDTADNAPTNDEPSATEPVTDPQALQLSEVLPDPTGDDREGEFIEIHNTADASMPLNGITIRDASGKSYTFADTPLPGGAYLALEREDSLIALNNGGDSVEIIDQNDKIIDSFTYEHSTTGSTHIRTENGWKQTTKPTPGAKNILQEPVNEDPRDDTETKQSSDTSESTAPLFTAVSISEAKQSADDEKVRVTGSVTVDPGTFGKQIFYLQDDTGGIQIYKHDAAFGDLKTGDGVEVAGVVRSSRGEKRVLVRGEMTPLDNTPDIAPRRIALTDVDDTAVGALIETTGTVMARNGNKITLQQNDTNLIVRVSDYDAIDPNMFERGSDVTVTGVYTASDDKRYLRPRTPDDIHIEHAQDDTAATVAMAGTTGNMQKQERFKRNAKILIGATTVGLSALLIKSNQDYFKRLYDNHFIDLKPTKTG